MSGEPARLRRLVVAFDPYAPDRAALQLARRLAAAEPQSLLALYVEETEALTLGSFPWAREIATATAEDRPLQREAVERNLSRRAAEARALFEAMAADASDARFERVRGRLAEELKRIAADATGVLVDWLPASRRSRPWAEGVVRALLELPAPLVGLVGPRGTASRSIVIAAGDDPVRAQAFAALLAAPARARITVVPGHPSAAGIIARARAESAGTLLVQRDAAGGRESLLAELALDWSGSLVLIR